MRPTSLRARAAGAIGALTVAGGVLVLAPPALAAGPVAATITNVPTAPPIFTNTASQAAGDWTVHVPSVGVGDTVTIAISDAGPTATGDSCSGATDTLAFSSTPKVTNTTTGSATIFTPTLGQSAACTGIANDVLTLIPDTATTGPVDLSITEIQYTVGAGASPGPVRTKVSTATTFSSAGSNAVIGSVGIERLAGSTRYATAEIIADTVERTSNGCHGTVIVANGINYPDALAASFLAGKTIPILLVADTVPTETATAIKQHGVTHIVIVGGPTSVSTSIESGFQNQNATTCGGGSTTSAKITTERIAGSDRYATAKAVAEARGLGGAGLAPTASSPTCSNVRTAIVASGESFSDALAAGVLSGGGAACGAGGKPLPLLLTTSGVVNLYASQALSDMAIKQVLVIGGPTSVSDAVVGSIRNLGGTNAITVQRISGPSRQGTAAALAAVLGSTGFGYAQGRIMVTRPDTFPDALVAAPLAAQLGAPVLLSDSTSSLGSTAANAIRTYPQPLDVAILLGGTSSLTQAVADAAAAAVAANPN